MKILHLLIFQGVAKRKKESTFISLSPQNQVLDIFFLEFVRLENDLSFELEQKSGALLATRRLLT